MWQQSSPYLSGSQIPGHGPPEAEDPWEENPSGVVIRTIINSASRSLTVPQEILWHPLAREVLLLPREKRRRLLAVRDISPCHSSPFLVTTDQCLITGVVEQNRGQSSRLIGKGYRSRSILHRFCTLRDCLLAGANIRPGHPAILNWSPPFVTIQNSRWDAEKYTVCLHQVVVINGEDLVRERAEPRLLRLGCDRLWSRNWVAEEGGNPQRNDAQTVRHGSITRGGQARFDCINLRHEWNRLNFASSEEQNIIDLIAPHLLDTLDGSQFLEHKVLWHGDMPSADAMRDVHADTEVLQSLEVAQQHFEHPPISFLEALHNEALIEQWANELLEHRQS